MSTNIDVLATNISERSGMMVANHLRKFMDDNDKNFTGKAKESFFYNKYDKSVKSSVPYAKVIDQGLPPNSDIDWNKLREWVAMSGKIDHDNTEYDIDDKTWRVYNKIKKHGIDPTFMVQKVLLGIERGESRAAV